VDETGVPGENHQPVASHWQTSSHNVVSSTPRLSGVRTFLLLTFWYIHYKKIKGKECIHAPKNILFKTLWHQDSLFIDSFKLLTHSERFSPIVNHTVSSCPPLILIGRWTHFTCAKTYKVTLCNITWTQHTGIKMSVSNFVESGDDDRDLWHVFCVEGRGWGFIYNSVVKICSKGFIFT